MTCNNELVTLKTLGVQVETATQRGGGHGKFLPASVVLPGQKIAVRCPYRTAAERERRADVGGRE